MLVILDLSDWSKLVFCCSLFWHETNFSNLKSRHVRDLLDREAL